MTDPLETIRAFRARGPAPDLDSLIARGRLNRRPRRVALLVAGIGLAVFLAGATLRFTLWTGPDNGPERVASGASTTQTTAPFPATTPTALAYTLTARGSGASLAVQGPGDLGAAPLGLSGDMTFTNTSDEPVVLLPPNWDASGRGFLSRTDCMHDEGSRCLPEARGTETLIEPGESALIPFALRAEAPTEQTFRIPFRWRPADMAAWSTGQLEVHLTVAASELPDESGPTTTQPN